MGEGSSAGSKPQARRMSKHAVETGSVLTAEGGAMDRGD
jgi:hypothetical protein